MPDETPPRIPKSLQAFVFIVKSLHFVNRTFALLAAVDNRLRIGNVDYGLSVHLSYSFPPIPPIRFASDKERNEHRRIHLLHVQATQATCVTRIYVFLCVV